MLEEAQMQLKLSQLHQLKTKVGSILDPDIRTYPHLHAVRSTGDEVLRRLSVIALWIALGKTGLFHAKMLQRIPTSEKMTNSTISTPT